MDIDPDEVDDRCASALKLFFGKALNRKYLANRSDLWDNHLKHFRNQTNAQTARQPIRTKSDCSGKANTKNSTDICSSARWKDRRYDYE